MRKTVLRLCLIANLSLSMGILFAQTPDTTYQNRIKEYTTDDRFYPESVASIYDHPSIASPLDHFGQIIGAPMVMHKTTEIYGYYQRLANESPNLTIEQAGTSEEGRPIYLVAISSEGNLKNADRFKEILASLADPRNITESEANELINEGLPVYYLNGGMHSPEMGSPEMLMELAYRLISDPSEEIQNVLDNTIVLINPVSEPDGRDKQVDWYHRYSKFRTDYYDGFRKTPPYWGKYVFHDNNRDGLQVSQEITKTIFSIFFDWHPTIMLDLHESVPLLYISTGTGPYNSNVDPITIGEWQSISNYEMTELAAQGLPGVFNWAFYDGWWPGYGIWVANNHNSIGRFYETFGNAGANTYMRDLSEAKIAGDPVTSREWYRPTPPSKKVYWSIRNNTNYMQAGVLASLFYTADNGKTFLRNFYKKSLNNTRTGEMGDTKMFTIPNEQRDQVMAAYLVNQLRVQGIEVQATADGEYAIYMDQPYSKLAIDLLTKQYYPPEAKFPPYDDIAWTLGYLYGVEVHMLDSIKYPKAETSLVDAPVKYEGSSTGDGNSFLLKNNAQATILPALYEVSELGRKASIHIMDTATVIAQDTVASGTIVIQGISSEQAGELAAKHGLDLVAEDRDTEDFRKIKLPRIAIYHSWYTTQDEGWARYTFEQKGIPYTSIDKDDLKAGKLNDHFDVIIIPDMRGDATYFVQGIPIDFGPMPFTKTDQFDSHGVPDATDDMTGGPGFEGVGKLSDFVKNGGVLIPLDNSSIIMADLGIGYRLSSFNPGGLFHPGSVVTVKSRGENPLLYGYPEVFHVFKGNGRLLETPLMDRHRMVLQYGTELLEDERPYEGEIMGMAEEENENENEAPDEVKDKEETEATPPYVLSGMVRNQQTIIGHGAIYEVPHGDGRVISFTFNPLHRFLNHHDSGLLWNAIMNWDYVANNPPD